MENRELYTHVFEYDGQACIAISHVKQGPCDQYVEIYDLDAGEITQCSIEEIYDAPKLRESEPEDFEFSVILDSPYADEAWEIKCELFD
jgi:hypothetical protein